MYLDNFKIQYFLVHLALSILVAACCMWIIFFIWHPQPLAKAIGVTNIFIMMLIIDVILGPLLTLLVAKQGKKTLKFDLFIIFLLQISALTYGVYNISISRPVWLAFDTMRFELVQANSIPTEMLQEAKFPYNQLSFLRPKWVAIKVAKNEEEKASRTFLELQTGVSPSMQPSLYEPLVKQAQVIQKKAKNLAELEQYNPKTDVEKTLAKYPKADAWLPLKANAVDMVVLVNKESASIIKIVDLRPWK